MFAAPYVIGVVVQLPLLIRYLADLVSRPHYGLYLLAFVATIAVSLLRWPWGQPVLHRNTIKSVLLAVLAVVAGLAGGLMVQPWLAALSVLLVIGSYLSATVHRDGLHSIGYGVLPLFAFLRPPLNFDLSINTWLHEGSVYLASRFMYVAGALLSHTVDESSFMMIQAESPYVFADSLIGIGSLYTLVFAALIYIALTRRNFFQSLLLIGTCFLWALILNTTYLVLLPVLNLYLDIDMLPGSTGHNMVRVLLLLGTVIMIFSAGMFFRFAFSPVDPEIGRSYDFGRFITAVWNNILAGEPFVNDTGQIVGRKPPTITQKPPSMLPRWIMAGALLIAGVLSFVFPGKTTGGEFSAVPLQLTVDDLPSTIDGWGLADRSFVDHQLPGTTVSGKAKSTWRYQTLDLQANCSVRQFFGMWYDLTSMYAGQGWDVGETTVLDVAQDDSAAGSWSFVQSSLSQLWGESGLLLYGYFDAAGNPVSPPVATGVIGSRLEAARQDVQGPLVQVSLWHSHYNELTADETAQLQNLFLAFREAARSRIMAGNVSVDDSSAPEVDLPNAASAP